MKIKRIQAPDMRVGIKKVRDELGPDAVILSQKSIEGGIEIVAAIDYDESAFQNESASMGDEASTVTRSPRPVTRAASSASSTKPADTKGGQHSWWVDDDLTDVAHSLGNTKHQAASLLGNAAHRSQAVPQPQPGMEDLRKDIQSLRELFEHQLSVLEWNKFARRHPQRAMLLKRLSEMGISPDLAQDLVANSDIQADFDTAWAAALKLLAAKIPVRTDDLLNGGGVIALVGPTGVGKTTTVAKLAARFALRHGRQKVALISTDNFRIGAQEQLRNFGKILGVPVHTVGDRESLHTTLARLVDKQLVLIDTAGMNQRDVQLAEQLAALHVDGGIKSFLVMSANTQTQALNDVVEGFSRVKLAGCMLTKLDEAASLGGALSVCVRHRLAISYLGTGQRVPEDLAAARGERLVEQADSLMRTYAEEDDRDVLAATFGKSAHVFG
jgi:flagellar biosynthesis protein FlhF